MVRRHYGYSPTTSAPCSDLGPPHDLFGTRPLSRILPYVTDTELVPLATDGDGNMLMAFQEIPEDADVLDAPLPAALMAVWTGDGRLLLVFDRYRQCWELPGGRIEAGETAREAAVRELREETGYQPAAIVFAGFARFTLGAERRSEYAAVYAAHAAPRGLFLPNEEIAAITWWDGAAPLPGRSQPMDLWLGLRARTAPAAGRPRPGRDDMRPEQVGPPPADEIAAGNHGVVAPRNLA